MPGQTVVIRAAPPCCRAATARELHENHMHQQDTFLCVLCLFILVKKIHGHLFSKGHTCATPWQNASYLHDPRSPFSSELEEVADWIREIHRTWISDHSWDCTDLQTGEGQRIPNVHVGIWPTLLERNAIQVVHVKIYEDTLLPLWGSDAVGQMAWGSRTRRQHATPAQCSVSLTLWGNHKLTYHMFIMTCTSRLDPQDC